jgi:hypothetical protein
MAAKKIQPKKEESMGSETVWKWVYVVGALVAGLAGAFGFTMLDPYLGWILIVVGILVGYFYFDPENLLNFGIFYLVLGAAASALASLIFVGSYLTGFFHGVFAFLGPVALTLLVRLFIKKNF